MRTKLMRQPGLVYLQQNKTKELRWSLPVDAVHKQVLCAVVCCSSVYILQSLQVPHKAQVVKQPQDKQKVVLHQYSQI